MISNIFGRQKTSVGLDVGSHSVKAVEISLQGPKKVLLRAACAEIVQEDKDGVSKAISGALAKARITSQTVRTAVGGEAVIVRYVQLPKMSEKDLAGAITFEAEKYIPFKRDDVTVDFEILEQEYRYDKDKMRILLAAAKKDVIAKQLGTLSALGVKVQLVDVESFSIMNCYEGTYPGHSEGTVGLINIGAKKTSVNIIKQGVPFFTRDIAIGGDDITNTIRNRLKGSFADAEKIKLDLSSKGEEIFEIAKPVLDRLLAEITLSFDYFENQIEKGLDRVLINGGTGRINGIDGYLEKKLGITTKTWDPLQGFELAQTIGKNAENGLGLQLAVSIGLALRAA